MARRQHACGQVILTLAAMSFPVAAGAQVTLYTNTGEYEAAGGALSIAIDFDSIRAETDIGAAQISGVTFNPLGSPLIVVVASSTFTPPGLFSGTDNPADNTLIATSGENVLSPGGEELGSGNDLDRDDWEMVFATPVQSLAFDVLYQSADSFSFTSMTAFDAQGVTIFSAGNLPVIDAKAPGGPGCPQFYGLVSIGAPIARVIISEDDDNTQFPDANIGMDTLRADVASACFPDCNEDGDLNILDFVCFQALFAAGDLGADCDGSGALNVLDFICFQGEFAKGCL